MRGEEKIYAGDYKLFEEEWGHALSELCRAISSSHLEGDDQRKRIREEIKVTLSRSSEALDASEKVRHSMEEIRELLDSLDKNDERHDRKHVKVKRLIR